MSDGKEYYLNTKINNGIDGKLNFSLCASTTQYVSIYSYTLKEFPPHFPLFKNTNIPHQHGPIRKYILHLNVLIPCHPS